MNFYNEDEKKDGVVAPGAFKKTSSFGKAPLFSRTAGGLMDRLKNLSRKDMAFVGIGLSVLVMAPVAEYMMSKPSSDNLLTPGFGSREGGVPTGLYEPGINALSQGSPDGSGEVITPLSSRDPASLILGSQPAAPAMPPPAPPTTSFRDSMKDVGRAAFSEASKAAPSPTPVPRMQSALRGMSSFFGGGDSTRTSGTLGGGKIIDDAKSASNKAAKRSMVGPVAMPGYKGVASNTPNSSSKGAFEKLRSAADKSAGNFTGGSAISSLDKAAADAPTVGAGGGGMGYGGDSEKTGKTSPYNNKYEHSRSGESLAEMAAKQRMQKALDWEFYKQYEIPKQLINAILTGITGPLTKFVDGTFTHILGMDPPPASKCWVPMGKQTGTLADDWKMAREKCKGSANPKCVLEWVCTIDGGPTQVSYQAGKESASAYEKNCMCNDYAGKTGTNPNPGNPDPKPDPKPDNPANPDTPVATAPEAENFDLAIKEIIRLTLEAQAAPEKAEKNMVGIVGNFKILEQQVNGPFMKVVGEKMNAADSVHKEYSRKVYAAQQEFNGLTGQYEKFAAAIAKLKADIAKNDVKPAAEAKPCEVKPCPEAAKLPAETIAKVNGYIAEWEAVLGGEASYLQAKGLVAAQLEWVPWYTGQLGLVSNGIDAMKGRQSEVSGVLSKVDSMDLAKKYKILTSKEAGAPAGVATEGSAKLAQAGDIRDAVGSAGAESSSGSQLLTEAGIRGAGWDPLWKNEISVKDATDNEKRDWSNMHGAAPATKGSIQPDNMVSNKMRSQSIVDSISSERMPGLVAISTKLEFTKTEMARIKGLILNSGASGSYFGGGAVVAARPQTSSDSAIMAAQTIVNDARRDYSARKLAYEGLSAEKQKEMAVSQQSLQAAEEVVEAKKAAYDKLVAPGSTATREARAKAARELTEASDQYQKFQMSYDATADMAKKRMTPTQQAALSNYQTIMACDAAVTGFRPNPSGECSKSRATRVATLFNSADINYRNIMEENAASKTALSNIVNERITACRWAATCLKSLPAGCR